MKKVEERQLNILKFAPIIILMATFAMFIVVMGMKGDWLSSGTGVEQIVPD